MIEKGKDLTKSLAQFNQQHPVLGHDTDVTRDICIAQLDRKQIEVV